MKALTLIILPVILASCATVAPPAKSGTVDHIVLIWLKRPGNADDRAAVLSASDSLRAIPGIRMLDAGTALSSDRPVVDDSFDVGFVMRFDSAAALKAYDAHPAHLAARKQLQALGSRVLVYDITR